jgi:esterase/lipase superfamily enzyme
MIMQTLRLLSLAAAFALTSGAPAWGQQEEAMSAALVRQLQDVEVQKQLIALGVLDATAGQASRSDLRRAVEWFRKAYQSARGVEPLTDDEQEKLKQAKAKFYAVTGLKELTYKDPNPKTKTDVQLLVPLKLVEGTPQRFDGGTSGGDWQEYRNNDGKVAVGPVIHLLSEYTPIALFRQSIMQVSLNYKHLHLTSEEFAVRGDVEDRDGGYVSSNLVLTFKDRLKGVFFRYPKTPLKSFVEVPDFLVPVVAVEPVSSGGPRPDPRARGWQLLMQGIANLMESEFPSKNGWTTVDTGPCPLSLHEGGAEPKSIRILFGTDRKAKAAPNQKGGPVADPDSLFANEPDNRLHLGCAYVVPQMRDVTSVGDLTPSKITMYRSLYSSPNGDLGDQLYLANELAESAQSRKRGRARATRQLTRENVSPENASSALVFIHGYNVAFKDALFTVANIVSDIQYEGRVYMYSWPSAVSTFRYISDMDNAEQAEPFLRSFLKLLLRDADIDYLDILVHSMGSQPVLRALSSLQSVFETERRAAVGSTKINIGQIMFAAPDVAGPLFDQKIRHIAPHANRVTIYTSSTDAALLASQLLRGGAPRMGEVDNDGQPQLVQVNNVHVINATTAMSWWRFVRGYGHDYFEQSGEVQSDIKQILQSRGDKEYLTPDLRRPELFEKVVFKGNKDWFFWRLRDRGSQEKK